MSVSDDIERRLQNWARWYHSGRGATSAGGIVSSIYFRGGRGPRAGTSMPLIDGEAVDTDTAIGRLVDTQRAALRARYLGLDSRGRRIPGVWTSVEVARRMGWAERTYRRHLEVARVALAAEITELRRRSDVRARGINPEENLADVE